MNIVTQGLNTAVTAEFVGAEHHSPTHRVLHVRLMNGYRLNTTITSDPAVAALWADDAPAGVFGLDIRPRPVSSAAAAVHELSPFLPPPATDLLALCVDRKCLLFVPARRGDLLPVELINFMTFEGNTIVGADVHNHLRILERDFRIVHDGRNAVDIMELAAEGYGPGDRYGIAGTTVLDDLTKFMIEAPGEEAMVGRWDRLPLSDAQIKTLTIHAVLGFDIGSFINAPNLRRRRGNM